MQQQPTPFSSTVNSVVIKILKSLAVENILFFSYCISIEVCSLFNLVFLYFLSLLCPLPVVHREEQVILSQIDSLSHFVIYFNFFDFMPNHFLFRSISAISKSPSLSSPLLCFLSSCPSCTFVSQYFYGGKFVLLVCLLLGFICSMERIFLFTFFIRRRFPFQHTNMHFNY